MLLNEFLKEEADWLPIHRFDNKAPITRQYLALDGQH